MTSPDHPDPRTVSTRCHWQTVLAEALTDPSELCRILRLPMSVAEEARRSAGRFRLLVPRPYLDRIRPGDLGDPLLRQILPRGAETDVVAGFVRDPLCESDFSGAPGLLSKYRGRSLIVTTGGCAVHCRFCFRRHQPVPAHRGELDLPEELVRTMATDRSLHEVILSGGDPLLLEDGVLEAISQEIARIGHIRRLRLHTRLPIVIPERVTEELLSWISRSRLTVILALHVNHPAEVDEAVARAVGRLADSGVPLLSQSVLLRGVNDNVEVLAELFERLIDLRIIPYYLHQLDRVAGAAHFEVPEETGIRLVTALRTRLPGYAVPRYVRDIPGNRSKQVLA